MKRFVVAALVFAAAAVPGPRATGGGMIRGLDVSHFNGRLSWPRIARAGYAFAFAQATKGNDGVDLLYERNRLGAAATGVAFGAYHYALPGGRTRADVVADARVEADHFLALADIADGDLVPVLDLERTGGLRPRALVTWATAWLDEIERRLGTRPTVYASPAFWRAAMADTAALAAAGSRLWVAHWRRGRPAVPARNWNGSGWTFWQRTDCARIRGIRGCLDGDVFNGRDLATVVLPPQPANTVPPALGGAVRVGGTLAATPGIWEALPPPTLAYRWQRCDAEGAACGRIRRATAPTYVVTPADRGHRLRAAVVASSRGRSATAYSELTEVVG